MESEMAGKRLQMLRELISDLASVAVLGSIAHGTSCLLLTYGFFGTTGTLPVGPIAVICRITSPSLAHAYCAAPGVGAWLEQQPSSPRGALLTSDGIEGSAH